MVYWEEYFYRSLSKGLGLNFGWLSVGCVTLDKLFNLGFLCFQSLCYFISDLKMDVDKHPGTTF